MVQTLPEPQALRPGVLRIIPLGGIGEVGRNMTTFEIDGQILIVDCGVLFPEESQPGVDLILPDFSALIWFSIFMASSTTTAWPLSID